MKKKIIILFLLLSQMTISTFRLDKEKIDIAIMNGGFMWEIGCSGVDLMEKYIKADHIIMMHLNSDEYENYVSIADHYKDIFPSIKIFMNSLDTATYIVH